MPLSGSNFCTADVSVSRGTAGGRAALQRPFCGQAVGYEPLLLALRCFDLSGRRVDLGGGSAVGSARGRHPLGEGRRGASGAQCPLLRGGRRRDCVEGRRRRAPGRPLEKGSCKGSEAPKHLRFLRRNAAIRAKTFFAPRDILCFLNSSKGIIGPVKLIPA